MSISKRPFSDIQGYGHVFSGNPLDRGEKERRDEAKLHEMTKHISSKFLPLRNLDLLVNTSDEPSLYWVNKDELARQNVESAPIFLGIMNERYHYAINVSENSFSDTNIRLINPDLRFVDIRTCGQMLEAQDAGVAAHARIQTYWHERYRYCSACGSETLMKRGGQSRSCARCGVEHFPRTDPVIIVVVHDGDRCLLGQSRGRLQQTNTYSALAGFVDQGECIEEAVAREVMEEAGIEVKNVRYHSSQPWPMPYSLMIGCHAEASTTNIDMDPEEMTDVKWFSREEVLKALDNKSDILRVPMKMAIAHHLVRSWALKEHN
mgnify:FL=1